MVKTTYNISSVELLTDKTDCHDITEILLKVALNTIKQTKHKMFAVLSDVYSL